MGEVTLEATVEVLKEKISGIEKDVAESTKEIADLKKKVESVEKNVTSHGNDIVELKTNDKNMSELLTDMRTEMRTDNKELKSDIKAMMEKLNATTISIYVLLLCGVGAGFWFVLEKLF